MTLVRLSSRPCLWFAMVLAALGLARSVQADDRLDALIDRVDAQDEEIRELREELRNVRAGTQAEAEAEMIEELREDLDELRADVGPPPKDPDYFRDDGELPLTDNPNPTIRLDIAGQVNQVMNVADDGDKTKVYFVDNDTSGSRIRFAGVSIFEEGPEVGATLEVALSPNNSFDVSQDNEIAGDFISVRRADIYVIDERFGRLMFGRGNAAAENTAEYDLSIVGGPIMMSGVSFPIGGLQFVEDGAPTGLSIGDAFFNFDGSRQNRVRYDTPMFGPFQLSGSAGADQRWDFAVTIGGDYDHWTGVELGPFTGLAAFSISDPSDHGVDYRVAGSASLLHRDSGLSLTGSSGFDAGVSGGTPYNVYGKLAWDTTPFAFGDTSFGVDYTWTENVDTAGNEGQSVGIAAVQGIRRFGVQLYSQYRWLTLDQEAAPNPDDIHVFTLGSRVRF